MNANSILPNVEDAVSRGWSVFPLAPNTKIPPKGLSWSSSDLPALSEWPEDTTGYGIDCGKSQLVVIDIDGEAGCNSFDALLDRYRIETWPDTFTVKTQSGGYHLYFTAVGYRNSASKIARGIDVRAEGGYVVGYGSTVNSKPYEVEHNTNVSGLPWWLAMELKPVEGYYLKTLDDLVAEVESAEHGTRNDTLNRIAFVAFNNDRIDDDEASQALHDAAVASGLSKQEVARTLNSALDGSQRVQADRASTTTTLTQPRATSQASSQPRTRPATALATVNRSTTLWTPTQANFDFIKFSDLSDEPVKYRIDGILPTEANVLFSAYQKTGKTTTIMSLLKSLTSPGDFIDHSCMTVAGRVVYVNFELSDPMLRKYAADAGINLDSDKMRVWQLRGNARQFPVLNDDFAVMFAEKLKEADCEVLVIDPLSPIMAAMGWDSNDNDRARQVCEGFSMVGQMADVSNIIIVDHTGHDTKTRSRGASGKGDWADVLWNLEKAGDTRKLKVEGRGVDENSILFKRDPQTGELATTVPKDVDGGDRKELLNALSKKPGSTSKDVQDATGWSKSTANRRLDDAVNEGIVLKSSKGRGSTPTYSLTEPSESE